MEEHIVYYLNLISKLTDILNYIEKNFKEDDITSYIKECKSICINKVKSEPLITIFLKELQEETSSNLQETSEENVDLEMQETITTLSNLLVSNTDTDNINPDMLESFGDGLARIFRQDAVTPEPTPPPPVPTPIGGPQIKTQIKNELNFVNTNINCQIKKKNEH